MDTITDRDYLVQLRRKLEARFNESELRTLCFDSGHTTTKPCQVPAKRTRRGNW